MELEDVSLLFNEERVLDHVSLRFEEGETTLIIGPSGCGKSSLLKVLAGLMPPNEGKVYFQGKNVAKMNEKHFQTMQFQTGFMFQDAALWANKSLYENLSFPILVANPKMKRAEVDRMIQESVKNMDFRTNLSLRPANLSAGEKKIISFMRATITNPSIFFMDEPTTFVDRRWVGLLKKQLKEIKEEGRTMVGITHNHRFAKELADRFIFLQRGHVLADGPPEELLNSDNPIIKEFVEELFG